MKTIPFFMALLFMGCTLNLSAQSSRENTNNTSSDAENRKHEIGLRINGFDDLKDFDFIYKYQLKSNKYFRVRLASANYNFQRSEIGGNSWNYGVGLFVGLEHRKAIRKDRLFFIHGFQGGISYGHQSTGNQGNISISPSIGYMFGLHYKLSSRFYLNLETTPTISSGLQFRDGDFQKNYRIRCNYNSSFAAFTLAYRF